MPRRRSRRRVVIVAGVCALATVVSVSAAAVASTSGAVSVTSLPRGVAPSFADRASAADVRALRAATAAILTDQDAVFDVSTERRATPDAATLALLTAPSAQAARIAVLRRGESDALAATAARSATFAFREDFGGTESTRFRDAQVTSASRFVPTRWQGIAVSGDRARVDVTGDDHAIAWDGTTRPAPSYQSKLLLIRSPSSPYGWRLTAQRAASTEQG